VTNKKRHIEHVEKSRANGDGARTDKKAKNVDNNNDSNNTTIHRNSSSNSLNNNNSNVNTTIQEQESVENMFNKSLATMPDLQSVNPDTVSLDSFARMYYKIQTLYEEWKEVRKNNFMRWR